MEQWGAVRQNGASPCLETGLADWIDWLGWLAGKPGWLGGLAESEGGQQRPDREGRWGGHPKPGNPGPLAPPP